MPIIETRIGMLIKMSIFRFLGSKRYNKKAALYAIIIIAGKYAMGLSVTIV
jgi:hypothetical protein